MIALKFGAGEHFNRMKLGLVSAIAVAHGAVLKALAVGVFGIAKILRYLEGALWPSRADLTAMLASILRGAVLAAFAPYTVDKPIPKTPERFGKGAMAGVAGPESANNAGAQTSFIPL